MDINTAATTTDDLTDGNSSMVDIIQIDTTPVTTVAEAKTKKALRQINLATIAQQLSTFATEEITNYPISVINNLNSEIRRIVAAYDTEIEKLRAGRNA